MNLWNNNIKENLTVGVLQYEIDTKYPENNFNIITKFLFKKNNDIVVLPEMGITGFSFKKLEKYIKESNSYVHILKEISEKYQTAICTTLPYKEGNYIYNRLFFVLPDHSYFWYDKQYLIDWGGFQEGKYFSNGNSFLVLQYMGWIIGFAICYDLRFPELFYRMNQYAYERYKDFIKLFLLPAQWPDRRIEHFVILSRARSIENLAYFVACNNIGRSGDLNFNGKSIIVNPDGKDLLLLEEKEGLFSTQILYNEVQQIQRSRPILIDRYKKLNFVDNL